MVSVWIHINSDRYWENPGIVINLPSLPRIGETVFLSEETLTFLVEQGLLNIQSWPGSTMNVRDQLVVKDICYIENEELAHILLTD